MSARAGHAGAGLGEEEGAQEPPLSHRLIDQVVPEELDWVELVRTYPLAALAVAAGIGFYLGRVHGERLLETVTEQADRRMSETADRLASAAESVLD